MALNELLSPWLDYFWSLPMWLRTTILIVAGLTLTRTAARTFQDETAMALLYIAIAVALFWAALLGLVDWMPG